MPRLARRRAAAFRGARDEGATGEGVGSTEASAIGSEVSVVIGEDCDPSVGSRVDSLILSGKSGVERDQTSIPKCTSINVRVQVANE